jgi:hypothetical protein
MADHSRIHISSGARRRSTSGAPISSGQMARIHGGPATGVPITTADCQAAIAPSPVATTATPRSKAAARRVRVMPPNVPIGRGGAYRPHGRK